MKKPGRPLNPDKFVDVLEIRLKASEKLAFKQAAEVAGIPVSTWARERLRRAAIRELERSGLPIPFVPRISMKEDGND